MTKLIYYLFEAEDTCPGCQERDNSFDYDELKRAIGLIKTLVWLCIAIFVGIVVGKL